MDPFTWFVAICLFLGYMATEVPYAIRGKTSPRRQARADRARARQALAGGGAAGTGGGGAVTGPARQALADWWGDWCGDATAWRRTRRQVRAARDATQPILAQPGAVSGLARRLAGADDPHAGAVPNGRNAALHAQFLQILARLGELDAWKRNMDALTADQRRQYWARIATLGPDDLAQQLDNELAEYRRAATQRQRADDLERRATEQAAALDDGPLLRSVPDDQIHFTNGGTSMSETVTLGQAIAWGTQQSEQAQAAMSDAEVVAASLASREVSGEPLALCAQIQEAASLLAGLYTQFSEVMSSHTSVAEAYAATPDAGDKEFNQLG